jgi:hypothetical protein
VKSLLTILLFSSLAANSQVSQLYFTKNPTNATGSVRKLTIVNDPSPALPGQTKIYLSRRAYLLIDSTGMGALSNTFQLLVSSSTSAGVYRRSDSVLVRTLWGGVTLPAGTYTKNTLWDGKDDAGNFLPNADYRVVVQANNITPIWEGVLGNTSDSMVGEKAFIYPQGFMYDMAAVNNHMYFAPGYNEGATLQLKYSLTNVQKQIKVLPQHTGIGPVSYLLCSDGINTYWGSHDAFSYPYNYTYNGVTRNGTGNTFVFATKVSDDTEVTFSNGLPYTLAIGRTVPSVISFDTTSTTFYKTITGLEVQKTGSYLFVARALTDTVKVYNKTTGAFVRKFYADSVRGLRIDSAGNMWMITGSTTPVVAKYTINSDGSLTAATLTLSGLVSPLAIGVSPDNTTIAISDGGTSMQVKAYNVNTGASVWTLGQAGGYATNSDAANDKFHFDNAKVFINDPNDPRKIFAPVTFQSDGSFWVGDCGNLRSIHFAANRTYITQIQVMGYNYSCAVDVNNPTRVFSNYLEFEIDYSKPLAPNNGSWVFKRNWSAGVVAANDNQFNRLMCVSTLSNGRTYALAPFNVGIDAGSATYTGTIVELVTGGKLRYTGIQTNAFNTGLTVVMDKDGSLISLPSTNVGQTGNWTRKPLTGFDGSNNPVYGTAAVFASVPAITNTDPVAPAIGSLAANHITSNGLLVSFDGSGYSPPRSTGYRLGGIKNGQWKWKTSFVTNRNYAGPFPNDGAFDIGNGVQYAGGFNAVVDSFVLWSYHGEFWKASQTNKMVLYSDNGLLLSVFGYTSDEAKAIADASGRTREAMYGMAGNSLNGYMVKVGSDIYLYHSDESQHAALHRWKISGLNTVKRFNYEVTKTADVAPTLNYVDLMAGLPLADTLAASVSGWSRNPTFETNGGNANSWLVRTGVQTYKVQDRDLNVVTRATNGVPTTKTVTRTLPVSTNTPMWHIEGQVQYAEGSEPENASNINAIQVLDNNDKVILSFNRSSRLAFNGTTVLGSTGVSLSPNPSIINQLRNLKIGYNETTAYCQYNDGTIVYAALADPTANPLRPAKIVIYTFSSNGNGHLVNVANLKWFTN